MNGLIIGLLLPFLGTTLGAACVFLMKNKIAPLLQKSLTGFAAGVMVAASVWSLLIPSMEMTGKEGIMSIVPALVGFLTGILFLLFLDIIVPHQHLDTNESEGPKSPLSKTAKLVFAITLHNLPEGMAVGVALAGALDHNSYMSMAGAIALSIGIAIQNFPEGAIVSMPLRTAGNSRRRSFVMGTLSGVVEPIGAILTIILASFGTYTSVFVGLCSRSYDVCCSRGINSGNPGRRPLKYGYYWICHRFYADDGVGCCSWIK